LDWWYDTRRVDAATVQSLADGFSRTLLELIREAVAEDDVDADSDEMELVDLS
jgi:phthiocerol/phenolphthiocerol synthesis type-I polyketide synthase E